MDHERIRQTVHPDSGAVKAPEVCPQCCGTGLVCSLEPIITPGACCVDYANAVCPGCGGSGKKKDTAS
ncbi:MAG: hypothetical protein WHS46_12770 [Desulfosoma sp.]